MVWKLFLWSSLRKSYCICLEILIWRNFGHFYPKFTVFLEFLTYNFQTLLWIFLIWSFRENHTLYADCEMFKIWPFLTKFRPLCEFLAFIFQKWLQISLPFFNFFEYWLFPGNQSYCVLFGRKYIALATKWCFNLLAYFLQCVDVVCLVG